MKNEKIIIRTNYLTYFCMTLLLKNCFLKPLTSHIPNAVTLLNLLSGAIAMMLASGGQTGTACYFILLAAVFDFLDGLVARWLGVHSSIGEQLDSLADMVSFGLAPAFLLFQHLRYIQPVHGEMLSLNNLSVATWLGLGVPFLITLCAALRLARFNTDVRQKDSFIGVPTPAAALFFATILLIYYQHQHGQQVQLFNSSWFWGALAVAFSGLMLAPVKMFSLKFKHLRWQNNQIRYVFVLISLFLLVSLQAVALPLIIVWYILLSIVYHIFDKKIRRL